MSILHSTTKLCIIFPLNHTFHGSLWKVYILTTITLFLLQCLNHAEYSISGWATCIRTKSTLIFCSKIMSVCVYTNIYIYTQMYEVNLGVWMLLKFCQKFIRVTFLDNYYRPLDLPFYKYVGYNNKLQYFH